MRRSPLALGLAFAAVVLLQPSVLAETTKTLRFELTPPQTGLYAVENLAGKMEVVAGSSDKVVAVATVHAESEELAGLVRLDQVTGKKGEPVLRVEYPLDRHTTYRYPTKGSNDSMLSSWFGGSSNTSTEYAGRKVHVSNSKGVLLYVDVTVEIPAGREGAFRNSVGALRGRGVEGTLTFDGASADVTLDAVRGVVTVDTGSGDIRAKDLQGSLRCDTGSGDIELKSFHGDDLRFDTGSGDVSVSEADARTLRADTGSGDINVRVTGLESFDANTGSGDVSLDARDGKAQRIRAETGSGDVMLRLGASASFEARADQGSGDLVSRYEDAQPILDGKELVGYRRGAAKTKIHVETGSGDVVLEPGS
jgi:DUF4097 and DUF4098 domain-containing protein YvlB